METIILRNLKALREFLHLSQQDFAEAVGVSTSLISLIESAQREPTAGFIARVCEAFHLRPNTIYDVELSPEEFKCAGGEPENASQEAKRADS